MYWEAGIKFLIAGIYSLMSQFFKKLKRSRIMGDATIDYAG